MNTIFLLPMNIAKLFALAPWRLPFAALLVVALVSFQARAFPILPSAPITVQGVGDPNILFTLDTSTSMESTYVPDAISGAMSAARGYAPNFNALAYNPRTVYEAPYDPSLMNGTRISTTFNSALIDGFNPVGGTINLSTTYRPQIRFVRKVGTPNLGAGQASYPSATSIHAPTGLVRFPRTRGYVYMFFAHLKSGLVLPNPGEDLGVALMNTTRPVGCLGITDVGNDACYYRVTIPVGSVHEQNFANWYSFYRTRTLTTISGANIAFFNLPTNYRVSWQGLFSCVGFNIGSCNDFDGTRYANRIRPFSDAAHKANFYKWMAKHVTVSSTPLIPSLERAGEFFRTTGIESPRANQPGVSESGPGTAAINTCRPNYHIMMTDGRWNSGTGTLGERDNVSRTLGDGTTAYSPQVPYRGAGSGNLSDVAFHYWATDLQPTVANSVVPFYAEGTDPFNPKNNPATWQHMVNFFVGLGLSVDLDGTSGKLRYVPPAPGDAPESSTYKGSFLDVMAGTTTWPVPTENNATTVSDLWHAALNSRGFFFSAEDPKLIRDAFASILGRVKQGQSSSGQSAAASGRTGIADNLILEVIYNPEYWSGSVNAYNLNRDGSRGSLAWTSNSTLVDDQNRNIITWDTASTSGVPFQWSSFSAAQRLSLFDNKEPMLNWVRGNRTNELPTGEFRKREFVLGDIIGSDIVISGKQDFGYSTLSDIAGGNSYKSYVSTKKTVIFAGSNDGMLHAFRRDGSEAFAYVPAAVLGKLKGHSSSPYIYSPKVDGPLALWDYYTGSAWKTVLIGGLGGGGRSVFALDVTKVITGTGTFSASDVLFEMTHADLGYSFSRPVVGRLPDGKWVAVFGNGYGADSKRAKLFVRDLNSGTLLPPIDTGTTDAASNGMSNPTGLSLQSGTINAIYSGDYRGNMWRFDIGAAGAFTVANAKAVFEAKDASGKRQPIMAAPKLMRHPGGGIMVLFGTGKFFEVEDRGNRDVQTFYGIRDVGLTTTIDRTGLVAQTLDASTLDVKNPRRTLTSAEVNYATKSGWYVDLNTVDGGAATGERVVASPVLIDEFVAFSTFFPNGNVCVGIGSSFLMGLNAFSGALTAPFLDDDGITKPGDLVGGKPVVGFSKGQATLFSPIAQIVTTNPLAALSLGTGRTDGCGGVNQAPCKAPNAPCIANTTLDPATNLCKQDKCPFGSISVDDKCALNGKTERWIELKWK